jgi:hypothetical protein
VKHAELGERVAGLITFRGRSIEVDDTLIYMTKAL